MIKLVPETSLYVVRNDPDGPLFFLNYEYSKTKQI